MCVRVRVCVCVCVCQEQTEFVKKEINDERDVKEECPSELEKMLTEKR